MQVKRGRMEKAEKDDSLYNPGKLFIGGLSWETTTEKLTNHFKKYGEIIDSVIMKDKETGHPRGFGFVTYSDASVIDKVLNEQHVLNGRIADVKKTVPRDKMVKGPKTKKIFVGGLPLTLKEEELKDYFSQFGKVVEHPIMLDKKNGNSRGFGFIVFDSEQAVENALSQGNYHQIAGKQVEIKKAEPKKSTEDVPPPPSHGPSQGRGAPGFSAGPYGRFGESYNSDFDSGFGPFGVGNYGSSGRYPDTGSYGVSAYGDRYKGSPLGGYSSGFGSYTGIGGSGPGGYDDIGRGGSNLGGYGDVGRRGGGPGGYGDVGRGGSSLGGYGDLGRGGVGLGGYGDLGRGGSLGGYGDGREGNSLGGNGDGKGGSRLGGYGDIGRGGSYLGIGGGVGFGGGYSPSGGVYGSSSNVGLNRSGKYGEPGGNARYHPYGRS